MEKDELFFIKLRNCFTAGYTLPQYCIDNGIKKPLFVSEKKFELFLWEVYIQFNYDKRLTARFCFADSDKIQINFCPHGGLIAPLTIQNFSDVKISDFDKIILLTNKNINVSKEKVICLSDLTRLFIQQVYCAVPLMNFLQRHPKVKLFVTNFPYNAVKRYKDWEEFKSKLWDYRPLQKTLIDNISKGITIPTPFDKFGYTNSQAVSLLKDAFAKRHPDGTTTMFDDDDPLIQIKDGKRKTAYQPEHFQNRIYILGTCHYFGTNAPFDKTITSYLQKMLNENNLPYRVENEGQCYWGRYQDVFYNLNKLNLAPGDIIFIYIENLMTDKLPFCNVDDAFDSYDCKEIFCRKGHINELGYKALAEKYFKFLTENNFFRDVEFDYHTPPPPITDTVYRLNSRAAVQNLSSTKNWKLTRKLYVKRKFKSARSS